MDFEWTADHLRLRRGAVEFAASRLADGVAQRDREGAFSREAWQACAEFGLLPRGSSCPRSGTAAVRTCCLPSAVFEGMGTARATTGWCSRSPPVRRTLICEGPLCAFGSEGEEHRVAAGPGQRKTPGDRREPRSPSRSGSSALALATDTPYAQATDTLSEKPPLQLVASPRSACSSCTPRTGPGFGGLTCFLVPRHTEGLVIGPPIEKMGLRTSLAMWQAYFDDCRLPASSVVGGSAGGDHVAGRTRWRSSGC